MQFKQIPLIQPSGVQPYTPHGGRPQGPALQAMLGGRTLFGFNPQDIQRRAQLSARVSGQRVPSLLDILLR
jgi:hypothetical protein